MGKKWWNIHRPSGSPERKPISLQLVAQHIESPTGKTIGARIVTFVIMLAIWLVFSGKFDLFHVGLGMICSALVALWSSDLLFSATMSWSVIRTWVRFGWYIPWLLYQILKANCHLLYLVFHPRMLELIDPRVIKFRSMIKDTIGLVTFANSITLTPGTITVYLSVYGDLTVHSIDSYSRESLPGEMERRIARVFES
ncbi:Na+/H+ antiporter subunit E [bacterium]|nr:Na+/H+ antiporter subunit E [bacterium]